MKRVPQKGHYIREWREHRGLSLARLAARMLDQTGEEVISSVSIGRMERGQQPYSQPILEALAHALTCEVDDLLSVNPLKEGEVVDFMQILRRMNKDQVAQLTKIAKAIA